MRPRQFILAGALFLHGCLTGCGITTRQAETAALEAANAAIVSAARDIDAQESADEAACQVKATADIDACIAHARRLNVALEAYDAWRVAWAALQAVWNAPAATDADIAKAQATVEAARARFWMAQVASEAGR